MSEQFQGAVQGGQQLLGVGLAHGPHQVRRAACDAGTVPERSGCQGEGQGHLAGGDRQRLGEQVGQVRDAGRRGVMLVGLGRNHDRFTVQRQVHDLGPHPGVDVFVDAKHPGRSDEHPGGACAPAGVRGAGHRMAAHVAIEQTGQPDLLEDRALDADDVGQGAVRGDVLDVAEQLRDGGHRDGQHDQRVPVGGPGEGLGQVGCRREAVGPGGFRALDGAVVAERLTACGYRCAHHRSADQPQPEHAHGCLRHAFQVGTPTSGTSHYLVNSPDQRLP